MKIFCFFGLHLWVHVSDKDHLSDPNKFISIQLCPHCGKSREVSLYDKPSQ